MSNAPHKLSTADLRRTTVIGSAITVFAEAGYLGTSVATIAQHAGISQAYVFKLFPSKELLFVTALEHCFTLVQTALEQGADASPDTSPDGVLDAMGGAYAELIADRSLLMLQVHAQSAASVPDIGAALRKGLRTITRFVLSRSGASDEAVQRFFAYWQLCHLIVVTGIEADNADWARVITKGIRHY